MHKLEVIFPYFESFDEELKKHLHHTLEKMTFKIEDILYINASNYNSQKGLVNPPIKLELD